jgi:ABC-type lipoprotein release transport system permease subunit
MTILKMAWRNLWRNRRRTLVNAVAGGFGLMLALAWSNLAQGNYRAMIRDAVRAGSGHAAVYSRDYLPLKRVEDTFVPGDLTDRAGAIPGAVAALPRLYLQGMAQSARGGRGAVILGMATDREAAMNPYLRKLADGRMLAPGERGGALAGAGLLKALKVPLGGKLVLTTTGKDGEMRGEVVRIRGIIKSGIKDVDDGMVVVSLPFAQELAGRPGEIHELALVLDETAAYRPEGITALRGMAAGHPGIGVYPWEEAMPTLRDGIAYDYVSLQITILIIYLILGVGVVNTQLMAVMERTREIGVMMAIGAPRQFPARLVMVEGFFLGLIAAAIGLVSGSLATWYLAVHGIDLSSWIKEEMEFAGVIFSTVLKARWAWKEMLELAGALVVIYTVAALYPARRATRVSPAEAMKS